MSHHHVHEWNKEQFDSTIHQSMGHHSHCPTTQDHCSLLTCPSVHVSPAHCAAMFVLCGWTGEGLWSVDSGQSALCTASAATASHCLPLVKVEGSEDDIQLFSRRPDTEKYILEQMSQSRHITEMDTAAGCTAGAATLTRPPGSRWWRSRPPC